MERVYGGQAKSEGGLAQEEHAADAIHSSLLMRGFSLFFRTVHVDDMKWAADARRPWDALACVS